LLSEVPVKTAQSHVQSKALIRASFKFVSVMIDCAFMLVMGVVNDHLFRCQRCTEMKIDFGASKFTYNIYSDIYSFFNSNLCHRTPILSASAYPVGRCRHANWLKPLALVSRPSPAP
jgi:hypothetical protein